MCVTDSTALRPRMTLSHMMITFNSLLHTATTLTWLSTKGNTHSQSASLNWEDHGPFLMVLHNICYGEWTEDWIESSTSRCSPQPGVSSYCSIDFGAVPFDLASLPFSRDLVTARGAHTWEEGINLEGKVLGSPTKISALESQGVLVF